MKTDPQIWISKVEGHIKSMACPNVYAPFPKY